MMDRLLHSTRTAARYLGISPAALRSAVRRGALTPAQRTRGGHLRFRTADLDSYAHTGATISTEDAAALPEDWLARLRASEARYRTIVETAREGVWHVDAAGHTTFVNAALVDMLGFTTAELYGRSYLDYLVEGDRTAATDRLAQRRATGRESGRYEARVRRKDGTALWVLLTITVLTNEVGEYDGAVAMISDIAARRQAEEDLRRSEGLFRALWEYTRDSVIILNDDGTFRYVSPSHMRLLGRQEHELLGAGAISNMHPDDVDWVRPRLAMVLQNPGATDTVTVRFRHADGSWRWIESVAVNHQEDPTINGTIIYSRDITERRHAEDALRASEERFRALSERASDLITLLDRDGTIRYASPSHLPLLGYSPSQLEGTKAFALIHPDDIEPTRMIFDRAMRTGGGGESHELRYHHADGTWRILEAIGVNRLEDPAVRGFIVNSRDITERKRAEATLAHQALHDALTNLPNRILFADRLDQALLAAQRRQSLVTLLLFDLDHFKEVNDTLGHHTGDLLLQEVAQRIGGLTRSTDTVARLGGDEFAVILPEADTAGAIRVSNQIMAALDTPFMVDGHTVNVGASIGIALYPTHSDDATTLMRRADVAMYQAKRDRSGYAIYDAARDQHSLQRMTLVAALRQAIPDDGLVLHYQPKFALVSGPPGKSNSSMPPRQGRLLGVEALVRWQHPERGLIPPDEFIPLAEETGLIKGLTERVLAMALAQCLTWQQKGLRIPIAVNLSVWNLRDPDLTQAVARLLQEFAIPASWLRLELTESAIMDDIARAINVLANLVALGVRVSIDDYGTGYSSLSYLQRLPVDELKIDRSFVRQMALNETDTTIVRSTVGLAHSLGLRAVAEGVEDEATWARLVAMGCDAAQGFGICRPIGADALERWLRTTGETPQPT